MKRLALILSLFVLFSTTLMGQVQRNRQLAWDDPDNAPGSIDHYTLYCGTAHSGPYGTAKVVIPASTLTGQVTLAKGTYYCVVTASNPDSESGYSNEVTTTIYDNAQKVINVKVTVSP